MNLTLIRDTFNALGIIGNIFNDDKSFILQTLEHAYPNEPYPVSASVSYEAKIPVGYYTCVRGLHILDPTPLFPNPKPFETFEITGVQGHSNLLFHTGNFNNDSRGCILLGLERDKTNMILNSREAFDKFMELQTGHDSFMLTIS